MYNTVNKNSDNAFKSTGSEINYTNNSIDNTKSNKQSINKYLKNPNYKSRKIKNASVDNKTNNRTYVCLPGNENDKNNNNMIEGKDKYCCHYFYESKKHSDDDISIKEKSNINDFKDNKSDNLKNNNINNNDIKINN